MTYLAEPHRARPPRRIGVLLVNLGTPDAPTAAAVRRYLAEFLSDPRVVEIPRVVVAADPARRDPARAAGAVGDEVRDDLEHGRLAAAGRTARSRRRCCRAISGSG